MALPDTINFLPGTALVWADTTDYASTLTGLARTAQLDLTSLAAGLAMQGAKVDLGSAFARQHLPYVGIEFDVAPTSGDLVEFWWAGSPITTPGSANPGGTTGVAGTYAGTASDSLADSKLSLQYLGTLIATADAATVVQYVTLPFFVPKLRFGMPVVVNSADQAFEGDAVEMLFALIPYTDQVVD